ncbi:MAG: hypothetical protein L3J53_04460 [Proteobacteria bacterium]|nr:hypothetical protein [Pseudomonadota bacterium]
MKSFQVVKCQSCGSSIVELQGQHLAKCSHCGSLMSKPLTGYKKLQGTMYFMLVMLVILAIAKNSQDISVGIAYAYAYASFTNMPAKTESGFKIRAGTFIAQEPGSWKLWAIGRKQRD